MRRFSLDGGQDRKSEFEIIATDYGCALSPLNSKVAENGAKAGGNLSQVPPLEKGESLSPTLPNMNFDLSLVLV